MNKTAEKIAEVFSEYGFGINREEVIRIFRGNPSLLKQNPTQKEFISEVFERFCFGSKKFVVVDFGKFHKKTELGDEWKDLPEWFTKNMAFEYTSWKRGIRSNGQSKTFSDFWMEVVPKGDFEYFETRMKDVERERYLLEKVFNPNSPELLEKRKRMLKKTYTELDRILAENAEFHKLTQKIQGLLTKEYQNLCKGVAVQKD